MRTLLRLLPVGLVSCLAVASFGACKDEPRVEATPAGTTQAAAQGPDQGKVCREVCQRATTCGTESLAKTIKGDPTEVALVNKVRARENETQAKCESACTADASAEGIDVTSACLSQESCETFTSCVERASAAPKVPR